MQELDLLCHARFEVVRIDMMRREACLLWGSVFVRCIDRGSKSLLLLLLCMKSFDGVRDIVDWYCCKHATFPIPNAWSSC